MSDPTFKMERKMDLFKCPNGHLTQVVRVRHPITSFLCEHCGEKAVPYEDGRGHDDRLPQIAGQFGMNIMEALAAVYAHPYKVGIRRPSWEFVLVYDLLFDKAGLAVFWRKSAARDGLMAGVGRGIALFDIGDVQAVDWETVHAGSAEAALYDTRGSDFK